MSFRKKGGEPEESSRLAIQNLVTELKEKGDQLGILLEVLLNQGKDLFRNRRNTQYCPCPCGGHRKSLISSQKLHILCQIFMITLFEQNQYLKTQQNV